MKRVLITGGSDGLGKVTAQKLIEAGFTATILGRNEAKTKVVAQELGCNYVVADLADLTQIQKALAQAGPVDVLINNAGLWVQGLLEENDPKRIQQVMDVNATGTILCTQAVVPAMKAQRAGRIVNVISNYGLDVKAERAVYSASKWAVTGFTKALQEELKPFNIAVTGLYPRAINSTHLFAEAGVNRKITTGLDPSTIAAAIANICQLPDGVNVPEFGIESLKY